MLALSVLGSTPAQATDNESAMRTFMTQNSVPRPQQDAIIAKLKAGILPDSEAGTAVPVREIRSVKDGYDVTKAVYADGSITVTKVERPGRTAKSGDVATLGTSVSGCQLVKTSNYSYQNQGCKADGQSVTLHISFYFTYDMISGRAPTFTPGWWHLDDATGVGSWSAEGFTQPGGASHLRYGGWQDAAGIFHTYRYLQVDLSGSSTATAIMR